MISAARWKQNEPGNGFAEGAAIGVRKKNAAASTADFSCRGDRDQQPDRSAKRGGQGVLSAWPLAGFPAGGARRSEFPHVHQPDDGGRDGETQRDRQDVWRADDHGEAVCEVVSGPRLQGVLRVPAAPQFGVGAERTRAATGATVARWGAERAGSGGGTERAAEQFAQSDPRGPFTRSSKKSDRDATEVTNQSERSQTDSQAPMGNGATRTLERVAAAMGELESAPIEFHPTCDVAQGGVLLALPALLAAGLLRRTPEFYQLPQGFYGMESIFLLLGLMALARI